jgi:hypothetical protein
MAHCIEYGGPLPPDHATLTLIQCRRKPDGVPCRGMLMVAKTDRDELHAYCASCESDEFLISNWQETLFAEGPPGAFPLKPEGVDDSRELAKDVSEALARALNALGSELSVGAVQEMIATAENPGAVMKVVFGRNPPRSLRDARAFADTLMATWNATPRPDLGGRTPEEVFSERRKQTPAVAPPRVGRNEPCRCGSGRKFKKCCGANSA